MSNKVIWSNHGTTDYAHGLNDEEKKNYLVDRGYDREMLSGDLDSVIADDDYMWKDDAEDFEYNVRPMIENQCRDGKVVLVGSVGRWDGAHNGGAIVNPEDLVNLDKDVDNIEIEDDGNGLIWLGHHHDGTIEMGMYHFSEDADAYKNELEALGVFDNYAKWYDDIEDVWSLSVGDLEPYIDFAKVPEVLPRIVDKMNEGLNEEEQINEVTVKEPKKLKREYKELKKLSDEYGFEYFTSMPLTAYDNDPQSVEYQYPEFFKIVKAFFKEMGIADNVKDNDELDMLWDTNIDQHDWDTLMKTCELCIENKTHSYQIEKIYKNGYATLDDDEILADREKEAERAAEYGESLDEAHNRAAGVHEFGEDPLELDMEDDGEAEGDFFEPWDHGDDEDLNATVYLYSMDYDGTPESLEAIKKDLTDHYVYDEDDEKFVAEVIKRIAAGENGKKESLDKEDFDDLDEETITRLINKKRKRESLIDEEPIKEDTLHRTKEWPWGVPKHLNNAE